MSSPTVDALRAELNAVRAVLAPQIRGLRDIQNDAPSAATLDAIAGHRVALENRDAAIRGAMAALDALDANGYPDDASTGGEASQDVIAELLQEQADIAAAIGVLVP
jgi:hypothetical protein